MAKDDSDPNCLVTGQGYPEFLCDISLTTHAEAYTGRTWVLSMGSRAEVPDPDIFLWSATNNASPHSYLGGLALKLSQSHFPGRL